MSSSNTTGATTGGTGPAIACARPVPTPPPTSRKRCRDHDQGGDSSTSFLAPTNAANPSQPFPSNTTPSSPSRLLATASSPSSPPPNQSIRIASPPRLTATPGHVHVHHPHAPKPSPPALVSVRALSPFITGTPSPLDEVDVSGVEEGKTDGINAGGVPTTLPPTTPLAPAAAPVCPLPPPTSALTSEHVIGPDVGPCAVSEEVDTTPPTTPLATTTTTTTTTTATTNARTCAILMEETEDWVQSPCCHQVVDTAVWVRIAAQHAKCPFCRSPMSPEESLSSAFHTASPAAKRLFSDLPEPYAAHVYSRLLHHYSTPTRVRAVAKELARLVTLSPSQQSRLQTLDPRQMKWFAATSAMCMWSNWLEVLPANASERPLARLSEWLTRKLPADATRVHAMIVESVRSAVGRHFAAEAPESLLPLVFKPLSEAILARLLALKVQGLQAARREREREQQQQQAVGQGQGQGQGQQG